MNRKYALITGFSIALSLAGSVALADDISDGVAKIPGLVDDIRIGGTWQDGDRSGAYRIVIARSGDDRVTARLFIQWIAYDADGTASVENSVEIKEMGDLHRDIADFNSESDSDGLSVFLDTVDDAGQSDETYELHVFSPTEYRFGPASN